MLSVAEHVATVDWRGPGAADVLAGRYSREHVVGFDGGVILPGSASPLGVRAPWSVEAAADPEEMLVAAVGACHMLTFIDLARRAGFATLSYRDRAAGRMGALPDGRLAVVRIALRPAIAWPPGGAPSAAELADLHARAHATCVIANSVIAEIVIEPPAATEAAGPGGAAVHA